MSRSLLQIHCWKPGCVLGSMAPSLPRGIYKCLEQILHASRGPNSLFMRGVRLSKLRSYLTCSASRSLIAATTRPVNYRVCSCVHFTAYHDCHITLSWGRN